MDPPVPVSVVVSGSDPPVPAFRLLLELSDLSSDRASAAEDFFPETGSFSAWQGFVETFQPGLGVPVGSKGAPPEPGGFIRSWEELCTGYGMLSQGSGNMLFWMKLVRDFRDGSCVSVSVRNADDWPRTRPFSPSAAGDAHPSYDLDISCFSAPQPFGPLLASRAMAGCISSSRMTLSHVLCLVCTFGYIRAFVFTLLAGIRFVCFSW